jgi:hypothetical protein
MKIFIFTLMVCLLWAMVPTTSVAESFRCGSHLIEEGMKRSEVIEYCGQPTSERGWTIVYDRGPESFNMLIHFNAAGTVDQIEEESED